MTFIIKISDGTNEVVLSPGATVRRSLDTEIGYEIFDRPNQQKPKIKDRGMVRNIYEVQTNFNERRLDYDKLFDTMVAGRTRGQEFTLTIERKTGDDEVITCIPYPGFVHERESGQGEFDDVILRFVEVSSVD